MRRFGCLRPPYLNNLGENRHLQAHAGSEGKTQHADPAAHDLRVCLQESVGFLQREQTHDTDAVTGLRSWFNGSISNCRGLKTESNLLKTTF